MPPNLIAFFGKVAIKKIAVAIYIDHIYSSANEGRQLIILPAGTPIKSKTGIVRHNVF